MTLYGAWWGELGWLVSTYAPALRDRSRRADRTVVALDESLAYLVGDFADEVVPLRCEGHAQHTGKVLEGGDRVAAMLSKATMSDAVLMGEWAVKNRKTIPVEFFKYGNPEKREPLIRSPDGAPNWTASGLDVVYFFRPPKPLSGGRGDPMRKSYPEPMAEELVSSLEERGSFGGCAGGPDNRRYGPSQDIRGIRMEELCDTLRHAKCAVGPSSGTLHLAAFCGCPVVTWTDGHADVRKRYELAPPLGWNPFGARAVYMGNKNPPPEAVADEVRKLCG